jgi:D-serine deaminase-like pyridoxal phosphate-dependent protein
MEILDNEDYADIISWLPHGRGFVIFRKKAFELKILPKHFHKQSKFSSFTRKLNRWSYVRVTRGPETGAYYNEFFRRDGHRLCMQMSCQSNAKSSGVSTSNVVNPDFSHIPTVVPTRSADSSTYPHNPDTAFQLALAEEAAMQQARHLAQLQQAQGIPMEHRGMSSQESMFLQAMAGRDAHGSASLTQLASMNGNSSLFGMMMPFQMPNQF